MGSHAPERLTEYRRRRDATRTPEPFGDEGATPSEGSRFVVHRHAARRLHYDLRLERDGVLMSWAVPKGLPFDPGARHLAVRVEDHPLAYADFEGEIPAGQYGAGRVEIWDAGTWEPLAEKADGGMSVRLRGARLEGVFELVPAALGGEEKNWLVIRKAEAGVEPVSGARPAPMLAVLEDAPPTAPGWVHEVKWDGFRCLARIHASEARLWSRNDQDLTGRFEAVARRLPWAVRTPECVLDGEVCALDGEGRPRFGLLQRGEGTVVYQVFDVLEADGRDACGRPWSERRALLERLVEPDDPLVRISPLFPDGGALLRAVEQQGLEGTVSKRATSRYRPGARSRDWRKAKVRHRRPFAIAGTRAGKGTRADLGALVFAVPVPAGWEWAGNCGSGLGDDDIAAVVAALAPHATDRPPFDPVPAGLARPRGATRWQAPAVVCEVEFTEWTADGRLRAPVFVALRPDIPAGAVPPRPARADAQAPAEAPEKAPEEAPGMATPPAPRRGHGAPVPLGRVTITNPEKVYFPEEGITKLQLASYYRDVAEAMVPHLQDRPMTMMRMPHGIEGKRIVQKNRPAHMPEWIPHAELPGGTSRRARLIRFPLVNEPDALVWMANAACIDMNTWYSRAASPQTPDWLLFDLDPADDADFGDAVRVALLVREALALVGLDCWAKTSSARGMHVMAPIAPEHEWAEARTFCKVIARALETAHPGLVTTAWAKERRRGVLIDCNQMGYGRTISAVYSVRPRPGAPVSTPLTWDEVEAGVDPRAFTMDAVRRRIERHGDLFAPVLGGGQSLGPALARLTAPGAPGP
jgi:bifunctional non-homologous end joining protein LigD